MQPLILFSILLLLIGILITSNLNIDTVDHLAYKDLDSYYNISTTNDSVSSSEGLVSLANSLYGIAILPIIIISLILLIAMIAPIFLCL